MKLGAIVLCLVGIVIFGYLFFSSKLQDKSGEKTSGPYINEQFGFQISYPKTSKTYTATCESYKSDKEVAVPIVAIPDEAKGAVYIANKSFVEVKNKFVGDGTYKYDFSKCKTVPTTLKLIKSGFSNGLPQKMGGITYPISMKFSYAKISSDQALAKFGELSLGVKNCQIASKEYVKGTKDSYRIKLRGQGSSGEMGGSCFINADYQFLYSPSSKTAVISNGYQNCVFGIGKACVPQVTLVD